MAWSTLIQAQQCSDDLMQKITVQNRRMLEQLAARCYYYHSRTYEFLDRLHNIRGYNETVLDRFVEQRFYLNIIRVHIY